MSQTVILMVAHGSPKPAGLKQTHAYREAFANHSQFPVLLSFIELAEPDLASGLIEAAKIAQSGGRVIVLPLLLGAANHQKNDIPVAIQWASKEFEGVGFHLASPFEPHGNLSRCLALRIEEALIRDKRALPEEESVVLVVGRGSSDPQSNSEIARLAYFLYEASFYKWVSFAFQACARPSVSEAVQQVIHCFKPSQLIIAPYLLFEGYVEEAIVLAAKQSAADTATRLVFSKPLGVHPLLIEVSKARVSECLEGRASMTCDLCKYRIPFVGYEDQVGQQQRSHHFHPK